MVDNENRDKKKGTLKTSFTKEEVDHEGPFEDPKLFFNRELSWLSFNKRVIDEAYDSNNPLLEQFNFLSIASSNLDEFFMVRVAGIYDQHLAGVEISENKTQMSPDDLLQAISDKNHANVDLQYQRYDKLLPSLKDLGYEVKKMKNLTTEELSQATKYFSDYILPTLSPLGVDAYRPFPHLNNKALNIMVSLNKDGEDQQAIVPIPALLERVLVFDASGGKAVIFTEDLIMHHLEYLFQGYNINFAYPFRVTRSADFDIKEDNAQDLIILIEDYVKKRRNGMAVRLEIDTRYVDDFNRKNVKFLKESLELNKRDIYFINGPLDLTFISKLTDIISDKHPEHTYKPFEPYLNPNYLGENLYTEIQQGDLFFNHPYDSFKPIVSMIERAADDDQTIAIKQTLYRVSKNSPIIAALKKAAERGKEVTVLVELKARFDEENNVYWARELEDAGCHVLYGVSELKTHSKITLIVRKEAQGIRRYLHLGTGNYNDKTAKQYTDMGIMSANLELTNDAANFFNYISGYTERPDYKHLHVSPFAIRDSLQDYIDEEIDYHKKYGNGRIIAKMNSLTDKPLIQKLYQASQAGVKIDLIVRGICCLRPGIPGVSETINVRSIVGRFLEHSRIYYFHRNGEHHLFLSSADMMTRNMTRRVEIEFPILDSDIESDILDILELQLADTLKARELHYSGEYTRLDSTGVRINAQEEQMKAANKRASQLVVKQEEKKKKLTWFERILSRFNRR